MVFLTPREEKKTLFLNLSVSLQLSPTLSFTRRRRLRQPQQQQQQQQQKKKKYPQRPSSPRRPPASLATPTPTTEPQSPLPRRKPCGAAPPSPRPKEGGGRPGTRSAAAAAPSRGRSRARKIEEVGKGVATVFAAAAVAVAAIRSGGGGGARRGGAATPLFPLLAAGGLAGKKNAAAAAAHDEALRDSFSCCNNSRGFTNNRRFFSILFSFFRPVFTCDFSNCKHDALCLSIRSFVRGRRACGSSRTLRERERVLFSRRSTLSRRVGQSRIRVHHPSKTPLRIRGINTKPNAGSCADAC